MTNSVADLECSSKASCWTLTAIVSIFSSLFTVLFIVGVSLVIYCGFYIKRSRTKRTEPPAAVIDDSEVVYDTVGDGITMSSLGMKDNEAYEQVS